MNPANLDPQGSCTLVKVQELKTRYNIVHSGIYTRLGKLNIKTKRIGRNSFITNVDLALMDKLHTHIARGGTMTEFISDSRIDRPTPVANNVLDCFQPLEEACKQEWLLSSSQLALLLGVSVTKIEESGTTFSDGGFMFCCEGSRLTGEAAWRVIKI